MKRTSNITALEQNANLCRILQRHAATVPFRPAIIDTIQRQDSAAATRVAGFAQLDAEVTEAASILQASGVRPLDVVLIYVPLQRELITLLLAVFRLGAQALFIDPAYSPRKIFHCLRLARPKFLVLDKKIEMLRTVAPLFGIKNVITFCRPEDTFEFSIKDCLNLKTTHNHAGSRAGSAAIADVADSHPALITFTSGSTGLPKGIVRTHGFLINQAALLKETLPSQTTDSYMQVLTTLPMFILSTLAAGDTAIIPARDDSALLNQLKYQAPDRLLCAPHTLGKICELLSQNSISLETIKDVVVGGGPVFPELIAKMHASMPSAILTTVYGSTEAEPICHRSYAPAETMKTKRGLPLGRKIDDIDLKVIDAALIRDHIDSKTDSARDGALVLTSDQFKAASLSFGKEGEIAVSGKHVIKSYLANIGDGKTKIIVDGQVYHRTGDAGYIDKNGDLYLTGRADCAVQMNGRTIYPLAIELMAMENKSIVRCALVESRGRAVLALELKDYADRREVLNELEQVFVRADIKIDRFVPIKNLPVDQRHQSKIVYSKLRRKLAFVW